MSGQLSKTASYLLIPYILWVSFASILNLSIAYSILKFDIFRLRVLLPNNARVKYSLISEEDRLKYAPELYGKGHILVTDGQKIWEVAD